MYSVDEITEPFWAEYSSEASGRDPLAIQNSSVVIYTKMVVGITNVTNRIRYNGFYCWLLDAILKSITKTNSLVEQIRYIRRAELLLAYIMVKKFSDTTGVSGSDYAKKNIQSQISLKDGADWDSKIEGGPSLYWKFKFGIFGQYYSGVVRELKLIMHPQGDLKIYTLTSTGTELADAFGKNIPDEERKLFWNCVYKGEVTENELSDLTSFALHTIPVNTEEQLFYEQMLLKEDDNKLEPSFHRRNTIKLILSFLNKEIDGVENLPAAFLHHNYNAHFSLSNLQYETSTAWYLFEINELVHLAFEHFHVCFLYTIEKYPTRMEDCLERLLNEVSNEFTNLGIDADTFTLVNLSGNIAKDNMDVYTYYNAMELAYKQKNYSSSLLHAILTLLSCLNNCKAHLSQLQEFASLPENNFNRNGYAIEIFEDLILSKWQLTIKEYAKDILLQAINRHTFSSYTKTKIGQSLVNNYMIEDDNVWRLRAIQPNRTTPRLQNVVQYLTDIGWMKRDNKKVQITDLGIQTLSNL